MSMKITKITRTQAWNNMLDIERSLRYCDKMHQFYKGFYFCSNSLLLLLGASSIAVLLSQLPHLYVVIINGIASFVAIINLVTNSGQNISNMRHLQERLSVLHNDYRNLWLNIENYKVDNDEVLEELSKLRKECNDANNNSGDLPRWSFLGRWCNKRAYKEANDILKNLYGSAPAQ